MANRSILSKILLAGSTFVGGMALGLLLSPKSGRENRKWLRGRADEMSDWVNEHGRHVISKSDRRLKNLGVEIRKNIDKNVPDLYRATEPLTLDESDFPQ